MEIKKGNNTKYFLIGLLVFTIVLAVLLIKPYLVPILTSVVLAYMFYPIYQWMNKRTKRENVSAFLVSIIILLIITVPLAFIGYQIYREANIGYIVIKQKLESGALFGAECTEGLICTATNKINDWVTTEEVKTRISESIGDMTTSLAEGAFGFVFSIPKRFVNLLVIFFITFFFLRDGEKFVKIIEKGAPLSKKQKQRIFSQMHEVTRAVIYGFFLVAIVEGTIIAATFSLFGITSPMIWGIIVALLALIPMIGAAVIWVPIVIFKFMAGDIGVGIGITVGGVIVSSIDTFLKPKIIGSRAAIHPAVVIIGVLGGVTLMGIVGIILGPLILALLFTFVKMYMYDRR